ncbi:MAG: hypothetical protein AB7F35_18540 [Acetobacteraceae bacterium]
MRTALLIAGVLLTALPAQAQDMRECQRNAARLGHTIECQEAIRRGYGALADAYARLAQQGPDMNMPDWWTRNPVARDAMLGQCQRRGEMEYPPPIGYCHAAGAAALQAVGPRPR